MFETGRRSAISSSELGLYSDRGEYNRSKYGPVVKKFVIGVMAIVAVILAAIFIYDFASGASANSKVSQDSKHIYVLQNAFKKLNTSIKKPYNHSTTPEISKLIIQDRSDDGNYSLIDDNDDFKGRSVDFEMPETRSQSLQNLKMRNKLLHNHDEEVERKIITNNHAVVYRVRHMFPHPVKEENNNNYEQESKPIPFHFEFKSPPPSSFKRLKYPQLNQYRNPYTTRSIQDIIKYLTNNEGTKHGIKFTGVYVHPNKYDLMSDGMAANSDRSELTSEAQEINNDDDDDDDDEENEDQDREDEAEHFGINDVFYHYKPKHPTDVNLLAPNNLRFSPLGLHRYNSYDHRPNIIMSKPQSNFDSYEAFDSTGAYAGGYGKRKKPKPFSVMLDIYPISDLNDQPTTKKTSRPSRPSRPSASDDYQDIRRPVTYPRANRFFPTVNYPESPQPIPVVAIPANQDDDEKKQMIFHLNLYPRKKNKLSRSDIIEKSESIGPEDHQMFMKKVMTPLNFITKQLSDQANIEEFKHRITSNDNNVTSSSFFQIPNENDDGGVMDNNQFSINQVPSNHNDNNDADEAKTEKDELEEKKIINQMTDTTTTTTNYNFDKFANGISSID